jgi:hypothetical protein
MLFTLAVELDTFSPRIAGLRITRPLYRNWRLTREEAWEYVNLCLRISSAIPRKKLLTSCYIVSNAGSTLSVGYKRTVVDLNGQKMDLHLPRHQMAIAADSTSR